MTDIRIPPDFRYLEILSRGRPLHEPYDDFSIRHPSMSLGRRAKIFSPFDALKGFGEAVAAKDVPYVPRRELSEKELETLDRNVSFLRDKITDSHAAARLNIRIRIEYFVLCRDPHNSAYGVLGQYHTLCGICREIDIHHRFIRVDERPVSFRDIAKVEILGEY